MEIDPYQMVADTFVPTSQNRILDFTKVKRAKKETFGFDITLILFHHSQEKLSTAYALGK